MPKSILLWTTRTPPNRAVLRLEFVRFFRLNRWLTYLIGVPLIVAVALLAIFFFAAFLGLIAAALAVAALRVWLLRRKLRQSRLVENLEGQQVGITQTRIVGKETDAANKEFQSHASS